MRYRIASFVAAFALLVPAPDFAACSSPAGNAADIIFNSSYDVPQYCDGTNWHPMGPINTGLGGSQCGNLTSGLNAWWNLHAAPNHTGFSAFARFRALC